MREWASITFKLYYVLRIQTYYSENPLDEEPPLPPLKNVFFRTIKDLKYLEFNLVKELLCLVEESENDTSGACLILSKYEKERRSMIESILQRLRPDRTTFQTENIHNEIMEYVHKSNAFLEELNTLANVVHC
ncbi:MAG: hypothetical protein HW390_649 [Candidatus Brocadiaceae bacterium]|nr:hypothetical protein [Candidatus Brocadiaceae bacterium]